MKIQSETNNGVLVIQILEQELHDASELLNIIQSGLDKGTLFFLVDLSHVIYISSIVLGSLVTTFKNIESKNGQLKFMHAQPCIANVFEMTRLNRIFEFFNERETALKSFTVPV